MTNDDIIREAREEEISAMRESVAPRTTWIRDRVLIAFRKRLHRAALVAVTSKSVQEFRYESFTLESVLKGIEGMTPWTDLESIVSDLHSEIQDLMEENDAWTAKDIRTVIEFHERRITGWRNAEEYIERTK